MMAAPAASPTSLQPPAAHAWDTAAEGWNRHSVLLDSWLAEVTEALLDAVRIGPGSRVLDIAAGAGDQTLCIAQRVGPNGYVLACDISPRILELAADKLCRAGFCNVETKVADAQALGLDGAGFDAAVCRLGLMFCRAPLDALTNARLALKPGSRFGAVVFSAPQGNPCIAIMAATARRHAGLPTASPFEPGSLLSLGQPGLLAELLTAAGFAHVEVHKVAAPMRLRSCRHYIDFVRTAGLPIMALLASLPTAAQQAAWLDIEGQLDQFATADGWQGPNELLLCSATCTDQGLVTTTTAP